MKIGVISDTHIPVRMPCLPQEVHEVFAGVDKILHAGDIEDIRVLDELTALAPVEAVAGNMDQGPHQLPYKREVRCGDVVIGLIHGYGVPRDQIRQRLRQEFNRVQVVVYGHTHQAFWGRESGLWFMNPGSPTDTVFAPYRSVGLLHIEDDRITGEIIRL